MSSTGALAPYDRTGGGRRRSLGAGYRPPLDGVRAIAVLAVMAHHFEPSFAGGFLGVDVFFVLSGYLITSLLLDEQLLVGRISLPRFYARRALRLLPALVPLFALVAVLWTLRPYASTFGPVGSMLIVLGYVGNWVVAISHDGLGYLTHTWSLAIEEQFYLGWPLALIWLLRHVASVRLAAGLVALVLMIGVVRAVGWTVLGGNALLFVTPTRADGLLLGCALALTLRSEPRNLWWSVAQRPLVGVLAVVALFAVFALASEAQAFAYLGGLSAAVVLSAVLITHLELAPTDRLGKLFAHQPLPGIGRISYGLYLFHYPVALYLYESADRTATSFIAKFVVSFMIAAASYLLIERPALRLKRRFRADAPAVSATPTTPEAPA